MKAGKIDPVQLKADIMRHNKDEKSAAAIDKLAEECGKINAPDRCELAAQVRACFDNNSMMKN